MKLRLFYYFFENFNNFSDYLLTYTTDTKIIKNFNLILLNLIKLNFVKSNLVKFNSN